MEDRKLTERIIGCAYRVVNYLVATRKAVGLLLNFGERKVDVKRKVRILE